ncbi:MAG: carbohydrate kinase family protein, partial [Thermomicrobiales bacterium]
MPANPRAPIAIVGNLNVDQWVQTVARFPEWDEELFVDSARIELAGSAGYLLQAWRGLGLDAFVSTIGDDAFGAFVGERLAALGVDPSGVEVLPGEETCLGMIFVGPGGERGILTALGAHARMDLGVAERHDRGVGECAEVVLCGGYLLPKLGPAELLPYARSLRARRQTVVFDPSWDPGGWSGATRRATLDLLAEVDVYLPNERELMGVTGADDLDAALRAVEGLAGETVVKRGAAGACHAAGGRRVDAPGFPVEAVNAIGAGDVFDAGYLHARRLGEPPEGRLRFACALAAMVVSQRGARTYPDAAAVRRFMADGAGSGRIAGR